MTRATPHALRLVPLLLAVMSAPDLVAAQVSSQEQAERVVVMVRARFDTDEQSAAGLVVGARTGRVYILTANHVVRQHGTTANVTVSFRSLPGEWYPAKVLDDADTRRDMAMLAVIEQPGQSLSAGLIPSAILGSPEALKVGDDLRAIGHPSGNAWQVNLSPFKYRKADGDYFSFETPLIQRGNSGGGVFDSDWRLVGMVVRDEPPDGVAASISRLLTQIKDWGYPVGLTGAVASRPAVSSLNVGSLPPSVAPPKRWMSSRSYPVDEQYPCPRGSQCFFMVRLLNVETDAEEKWLRFNFVAEQAFLTSHSSWKWIDLYLDRPDETTFLVDQRGSQHLLAAATGLSAEKPTRIPYRGSSRFALVFPIASNISSFRYETALYYRWGPTPEQVERVQIKGSKPISLADFR